jgi:hypothetical protein
MKRNEMQCNEMHFDERESDKTPTFLFSRPLLPQFHQTSEVPDIRGKVGRFLSLTLGGLIGRRTFLHEARHFFSPPSQLGFASCSRAVVTHNSLLS